MAKTFHKNILTTWVHEAVLAYGGSASIPEVCKHIWQNHENDLRNMGDTFFTWQYDVRWAAQQLRDDGVFKKSNDETITVKRNWELL